MPKPSKDKPAFDELLSRIKHDYPRIKFCSGRQFYWSPNEKTIYFSTEIRPNEAGHLILHELAHMELKHTNYDYDVELIQMELAAWEYSKANFYPQYLPEFNQTLQDGYLESYRDWLYRRSLCPKCNLTGQQLANHSYSCPTCHQKWQPNIAKQNRLQRRQIKNRP